MAPFAPALLTLLAQAGTAQVQGPPAPPPDSVAAAEASDPCASTPETTREIVVCAQRPNGYRLNPDVMDAKREARSAGTPRKPGGVTRPDCATVGPAPCASGGISPIAVALTAVEIAQRLAKGQEIGSIFKTGHEPTEYELYLIAKARREARELEEKDAEAAAKAKAAAAAAAPKPPQ